MGSLNTKRVNSVNTLKDYIDQLNRRWELLEKRLEQLEKRTEGLGAARTFDPTKCQEFK